MKANRKGMTNKLSSHVDSHHHFSHPTFQHNMEKCDCIWPLEMKII